MNTLKCYQTKYYETNLHFLLYIPCVKRLLKPHHRTSERNQITFVQLVGLLVVCCVIDRLVAIEYMLSAELGPAAGGALLLVSSLINQNYHCS